jgi:hypothetical protein
VTVNALNEVGALPVDTLCKLQAGASAGGRAKGEVNLLAIRRLPWLAVDEPGPDSLTGAVFLADPSQMPRDSAAGTLAYDPPKGTNVFRGRPAAAADEGDA